MKTPSLQSWEVPSDVQLLSTSVSQVKSRFSIGASTWTVGLLQMPTPSSPVLWLGVQNGDSGFVAFADGNSYQLEQFDASTEPLAVRLSFSYLLGKNHFARLFFLNEQGKLRSHNEVAHEAIMVASNGFAAWGEPPTAFGIYYPWTFKWSEPMTSAEFLRLSAREVWECVQQLLADEEGDARFTRKFALYSQAERHHLVFSNKRGTDDEFKGLLRDCALLQNPFDNVPSNFPPVYADRFGLYSSSWGQIEFTVENDKAVFCVDPSPDFLNMVEKIWHWFRPLNKEVAQRSTVREWLRRDADSFTIPLAYPSAHERLEAALSWREWVEQHGE